MLDNISSINRGGEMDKVLEAGDTVFINDDIPGVIEEVIWVRGMGWPYYLIEWWHEGDVRSRRFHPNEVKTSGT